jgi:NTP pyrophosphatase (non-canonical NTP hydrolase)
MTMDYKELQKRVIAFRDARNWKQFHNPKDCAISLNLEAAELLEHFQWKTEEEFKEYLKKAKGEIGDELMDVLYWVLLLSHDLDIDIPKAFNRKMAKNNKKYPVKKASGNHSKYTQL